MKEGIWVDFDLDSLSSMSEWVSSLRSSSPTKQPQGKAKVQQVFDAGKSKTTFTKRQLLRLGSLDEPSNPAAQLIPSIETPRFRLVDWGATQNLVSGQDVRIVG